MRIIYITGEPEGFTLGGVGRYYLETYPQLLKMGHRVDVIACLSYVLDEIQSSQNKLVEIKQRTPLIASINTKLIPNEDDIEAYPADTATHIFELVSPHLADNYDVIFANDYYSFPVVRELLIMYPGAKLVYFNHLPFEVGFSYFTNPKLNQLLL